MPSCARRQPGKSRRLSCKRVPYRVHTVLTDNGIQFTDLPRNRTGPTARYSVHLFERDKRPGRRKEATVKKYHYETHQNLRDHLQTFLMAYNFAKRLKTLKGLLTNSSVNVGQKSQKNSG